MQHNLQSDNSIIQPIDHLTVNTLAWSPYCEMIGIGTTPAVNLKNMSILQKNKKLGGNGNREFEYFPTVSNIYAIFFNLTNTILETRNSQPTSTYNGHYGIPIYGRILLPKS
jgi:hypothetical protein